jgi:hypothetical protein
MPDVPQPQPLHPYLAITLGRVVMRWSALEYWTTLLLGTLLHADQAAMSVIGNSVSISTQSKWIRALLAGKPEEKEAADQIIELLSRADDLRSERNEFVHGMWDETDCEPGTALVQTVNLDRREIIRSRLVTFQDIYDLIGEIDMWIDDYVALGRKLGFPRHAGQAVSMFND